MRITAGFNTGMVSRPDSAGGKVKGFGFESMGGGLGFSHNVGYDFEYGVAAYFGARNRLKMFNDAGKETGVMNARWEVMFRYMPQVMEGFNAGGILSFGGDHGFGASDKDPSAKEYKELVSFGDMNLKVGPAVSYNVADIVTFGFAPYFAWNTIRIHSDKANDDYKKKANGMGMGLPLDIVFNVMENASVGLKADTQFNRFNGEKVKAMDHFKEEVTLNFSYNM
jgi:hypothetical protein